MELPSLNDRKEDIPALIAFFLDDLRAKLGTKCSLHEDVIGYLSQKDYVGNIRELRNDVERLLVLNQEKAVIQLQDLETGFSISKSPRVSQKNQNFDYQRGLGTIVEELEVQLISHALKDHNFNQVHTAKALGITRGSLQYKMQKYNLVDEKAA